MIDFTFLVVGSLMLLLGYAVMGRSNLGRMKQQADKAWALIEKPVSQRREAVRELEAWCQRSMPHESAALARVLAAQAQVVSAHQAFDVAAFCAAETELRTGLNLLFTAAQRGGEQSATENLRRRISGHGTDIAERSRLYNSAANFHNMQIKQFPYLLLARPLGFQPFDRLASDRWETSGLRDSIPPQP